MSISDKIRGGLGSCVFRYLSLFLLAGSLACPPSTVAAEQNQEESFEGDDAVEDDLGDDELDDEFALLEEEDIIYSAAKHKQVISDSPASITVITREQIENSHCTDIVCLIRQVPEMELRRYRALTQQVGARSMGILVGDKHLVLVDGREVNVEAFGLPFWKALPIHLEDVERIEVTRGPGSALYGANAHSAVIAITSRRIDKTRQSAYMGGGELGRTWAGARSALKLDKWGLEILASMDREGHWEHPGLIEREVVRARLRLQRDWDEAGKSELHLGTTFVEGQMGSILGPMRMESSHLAHGILSHETDMVRAHLQASVFKGDLLFDLPLYFGDVLLGTFPKVIGLFSSNLDADIQFNYSAWKGNLFIAGANYRWLTYMSEQNYPENTHQHRAGLLVQVEQRLWDQLLITLGGRFDYNNITPFTISPRLAIVWRFLPDQVLRLSGGQAFRKPSFFNTSIHIQGVEGTPAFPNLGEFFRRNIGNENLKNESVTSVELGYRGKFFDDAVTLELTAFMAFYRDSTNFDFQMEYNMLGLPDLSCPNDPSEPCNSSILFRSEGWETNTVGGTLAVDWRPLEQLRISGNYTQRYTWFVNKTPQATDVTGDQVGDQFRYEPQHLANLALHYLSGFGLRMGLSAFARSDHMFVRVADGSLFGEKIEIHNPADWMLGGYLSFRLNLADHWLEAGIRAFNVLNQPYRDATAITRFDGQMMGGHLMARRAVLFLRGEY